MIMLPLSALKAHDDDDSLGSSPGRRVPLPMGTLDAMSDISTEACPETLRVGMVWRGHRRSDNEDKEKRRRLKDGCRIMLKLKKRARTLYMKNHGSRLMVKRRQTMCRLVERKKQYLALPLALLAMGWMDRRPFTQPYHPT